MNTDATIDISATEEERFILSFGLGEWGGPASCTAELAIAMGFEDVADLHATGQRIATDVTANTPLTQLDWVRALFATEVVFASDVVGSGLDWAVTSGISDADTIRLLRSIQRKLAASIDAR